MFSLVVRMGMGVGVGVGVGMGVKMMSGEKGSGFGFVFADEKKKSDLHFEVLVVGGGTGGLIVTNQLKKKKKDVKVAIVEPNDIHNYQPGWTLVAARLLDWKKTEDKTANYIPKDVQWLQTKVSEVNADNNQVTLSDGRVVTYDYLVVSTGLETHFDRVKGMKEAMDADVDKTSGVCSVYEKRYVDGVWRKIDNLKTGDIAIFTQTSTTMKCAGAPQKIMYLAECHTSRKGVKPSYHFIIPQGAVFGVEFARPLLERIMKEKGIQWLCGEELVEIKGQERLAVFRKNADGTMTSRPYDMLHVVPFMCPPAPIRNSKLSNPQGFVEVDQRTTQHVRYKNVFALGDSSSLPTSKTAAAIGSQAPVLVHNLTQVMQNKPPLATYDGYASCPVLTGKNKVLLLEFKYGGEKFLSFGKWPWNMVIDQEKENGWMYVLKRYVFPSVYWRMLNGGWYGHDAFWAPKFPEGEVEKK